MPFVAVRADPDTPSDQPPDPLRLAYFSAREIKAQLPQDRAAEVSSARWQLSTPFGYRAEDGRYFVVPAHTGNVWSAGNSTDLASVPDFLWGILAPYGRQLRPALLHDHRCDVADGLVPDDPDNRSAAGSPVPPGRAPAQIRVEADYLFREALRAEGVGPGRSWLFWTGVSFGRFFTYTKALAAGLALLVGAVGVLGLHALTVVLGGGPPRVDGWLAQWPFWWAMLGVLAVLAVLRRRIMRFTIPLSLVTTVVWLSGAAPGSPRVLHSLGWHAVAAAVLLAGAVLLGLLTDVRAAVLAMVIAPLLLPVVIVTMLAQLTLALPDLIWWALHGYQGDEPIVGPLFGPPAPGRL